MIPNRSKSYRLAPQCIISTAQQARPKVIGQIEPVRAQFTSLSMEDTTNSALLLGIEGKVGAEEVVDVESFNGETANAGRT
mmetsp:Transcript_2818/g.4088  ORF Transcript_2818/g.4088 Transcript_2818/m.4088 type:complete len:81 (-) Transcript_2818:73-315(-)